VAVNHWLSAGAHGLAHLDSKLRHKPRLGDNRHPQTSSLGYLVVCDDTTVFNPVRHHWLPIDAHGLVEGVQCEGDCPVANGVCRHRPPSGSSLQDVFTQLFLWCLEIAVIVRWACRKWL
jgi:hypothetical protein